MFFGFNFRILCITNREDHRHLTTIYSDLQSDTPKNIRGYYMTSSPVCLCGLSQVSVKSREGLRYKTCLENIE